MSKYFNNTESLSTSISDISEENNSIIPTHIQQIDNDGKANLQSKLNNSLDDEIKKVASQSAIIDDSMDELKKVTDSYAEIENALKKFKPLELFERLNQITFLMIEMRNRLDAIENHLRLDEEKPLKSPIEQFNETSNNDDLMDPKVAKEQLNSIQKGNIPTIPNENYIENGVNLEEMFPGKPDEAYQAAYKSLAENQDKLNTQTVSKSPKGGIQGIRF